MGTEPHALSHTAPPRNIRKLVSQYLKGVPHYLQPSMRGRAGAKVCFLHNSLLRGDRSTQAVTRFMGRGGGRKETALSADAAQSTGPLWQLKVIYTVGASGEGPSGLWLEGAQNQAHGKRRQLQIAPLSEPFMNEVFYFSSSEDLNCQLSVFWLNVLQRGRLLIRKLNSFEGAFEVPVLPPLTSWLADVMTGHHNPALSWGGSSWVNLIAR